MYELLSLLVGLTFWALVGWGAYLTYRAIARCVPVLDRVLNARVRAARSTVTSSQGTTRLGVTYLWALGNHHTRYRAATNDAPATSEEPRYLDAA